MEKVSLLKIDSYENGLKDHLAELLAPLGGLGQFVTSGDKVLLKANFVLPRSAESATTTNPQFILAVAELLQDYGCQVALGDSPGYASAAEVIKKLGLTDELKHRGIETVEFLTPTDIVTATKLPWEPRFKNLSLAQEVFERKIINLPKLKSHGQMGITLATKNLYGCVPGTAKGQWHFTAGRDLLSFAQLLIEIAYTVNPCLHILDGIVGMDGNGPSNGRVRHFGVTAAAADSLALDRVIAELIQHDPQQFPLFKAAERIGLGNAELENICICGAAPETCLIEDFEIPALKPLDIFVNRALSDLAEHLIRQRIKLDKSKCVMCRKCFQLCPAKAITAEKSIVINEHKCIKCCCCQEMCPTGALRVYNPPLFRFFVRLRKNKKAKKTRRNCHDATD